MAWEKGKSGNPNGRPKKGKTLTEALQKAGKKRVRTHPVTGATINNFDYIAWKLFDLAADGNVAAIKYIGDRVDGTPIQTIKDEGGPKTLIIRRIPAEDEEGEEDD